MPAEFVQGFFVREAAWHRLGTVLDYYPGREEAMKLAGHNWDVVELDDVRIGIPNEVLAAAGQPTNPNPGASGFLRQAKGWKGHFRSDNLELLHVSQESFHRIPNSIAYDIAEAVLEGDSNFKYETGITLRGGALCAITLRLDEPIQIPGDDSPLLPFFGLSWAHDGSGAVKGRSGTIRQVCANTVAASEAEGLKLNTSFSIKHTKNWRLKVDDAKRAIKGVREEAEATEKFGHELAEMYLRKESIEEFLIRFTTPRQAFEVASVSKRVQSNIAKAQRELRSILNGPTTPEAHRETAWGVWNAAVEYLDHVRPTRGTTTRAKDESFTNRTLLTNNGGKNVALNLLREIYKEQKPFAAV
jgi:phage/plasmid-like protein (TIGR03299 family)